MRWILVADRAVGPISLQIKIRLIIYLRVTIWTLSGSTVTNLRRCFGFVFFFLLPLSFAACCLFFLSILFAMWWPCLQTLWDGVEVGGLARRGGLPDNGAASPAARRACQPAGGIEVNKLKCMYMLRDRLLPEQRGICGTGLLGSPGQP